MLREINENWITEDKLLSANDEAAVVCNDCAGCSECCTETGCMIILDAYDVKMLVRELNYSFEGLLSAGLVRFDVVDGVVLPGLGVDEKGACAFLGKNGRCSIHNARPGICRLFPLARIYHDDGSFSYFLQESECGRRTGEKIKVADWLGYDDIEEYEKQVRIYHDALTELKENCKNAKSAEEVTALQSAFLKKWFLNA